MMSVEDMPSLTNARVSGDGDRLVGYGARTTVAPQSSRTPCIRAAGHSDGWNGT